MLKTDSANRKRCNFLTAMPSLETNRLVLRNDACRIETAGRMDRGLGRTGDLPPNISFALQLCLEEAVANIIMHGGAKDERLEVAVELERKG
jgi:anti-sigma regulatory factor (Ser/Thr protein kinase)